jgi:hypothetical protein
MELLRENGIENQVLTGRKSGRDIPANIDVRFFFGNMFYSGTLLTFSEKEMFIKTTIRLPAEAMFIIIIPIEGECLNIIARVRKTAENSPVSSGMAVELLNPPEKYANYVIKNRSALNE